MNEETTARGIVLRRRDSGESDRVLTLFTKEQGRLTVVARGARKATSRLRSVSEPLSAGRFTLVKGRVRTFVTQVQPTWTAQQLRTDYDRLLLGLAWTELLSHVIPEGEPLPGLFQLCLDHLLALESAEHPLVAELWAEVRLLHETGFLPQFNRCVATGMPIQEQEASFSAIGGGYLSGEFSHSFRDRLVVRAEALMGLAALGGLPEPPPKMKFAVEGFRVLQSVWENVCDAALPARLAALNEFKGHSLGIQAKPNPPAERENRSVK